MAKWCVISAPQPTPLYFEEGEAVQAKSDTNVPMPIKFHFIEVLRGAHMLNLKALIGTFIITILATILYRIFLHPLARVPGPRLAAITGLWRSYHYARGEWHDEILQLHRTFGRVVRIAPNEVSVVDAATAKQLFGHGTSARKTTWYSTWQRSTVGPNIFPTQDPKLHSALRKRVTPAYSMSSILKFEQYIQGCLDLCFSKLKKHAEKGQMVDLTDWAAMLTYDVIGELGYGQQFGQLRTESDNYGLRTMFAEGFKILTLLGHFPGQSRFLESPTFNGFMKFLGIPHPLKKFEVMTTERVNARRNETDGADRPDMLSHFLKMRTLDGKSPATNMEVLGEADTLIGAGADTTAFGMTSCAFHICTHPPVYQRLQDEIDKFYEDNKLTEPISYVQTQAMPYLKAVVSEALRISPAIPFQLLRYSPEGGMTVEGHYIPAGSEIGISAMAQNRDTAVFGKDAEDFRPERYLESSERNSIMESSLMTWGGNGARTCIGRNIALVEISKFIVQLLRNFDIKLIDKEQRMDIITYWFTHQHNMNVRLKLRPGRTIHEVDV